MICISHEPPCQSEPFFSTKRLVLRITSHLWGSPATPETHHGDELHDACSSEVFQLVPIGETKKEDRLGLHAFPTRAHRLQRWCLGRRASGDLCRQWVDVGRPKIWVYNCWVPIPRSFWVGIAVKPCIRHAPCETSRNTQACSTHLNRRFLSPLWCQLQPVSRSRNGGITRPYQQRIMDIPSMRTIHRPTVCVHFSMASVDPCWVIFGQTQWGNGDFSK